MPLCKTRLWGADMVLLSLLTLTVLSACLGAVETKPSLTEPCHLDWQQEAGLAQGALPDSTVSPGLTVLVFNIHDRLLSNWFISSEAHTEEEIACIGDLASRFDLVLFQEAFVRPAQLAQYTKHAWANHPLFTKGGGGDWWPLRAMCKICLSPGLLMLAREQPESVHSEPYEASAGWNTDMNKADDFFSKGFQLVQFPSFWVLNSHMDAGRGEASIKARALQFRQITAGVRRLISPEAPLLVGMDANLRPEQEERDAEILEEFLEANALTLVQQSGPDLIAVRGIGIDRPQSLPFKGILSDHNALSVIMYPPSTLKSQD
jgi:hypothetical protein